jgi:hypothetical protein
VTRLGARVADVYVGDDDLAGAGVRPRATSTYEFHVSADVQPNVVAQIAGQFTFANEAPLYFDFRAHAAGIGHARIRIAGVTAEMADLVARKLSRLTCVREVIVTAGAAWEAPASTHG